MSDLECWQCEGEEPCSKCGIPSTADPCPECKRLLEDLPKGSIHPNHSGDPS